MRNGKGHDENKVKAAGFQFRPPLQPSRMESLYFSLYFCTLFFNLLTIRDIHYRPTLFCFSPLYVRSGPDLNSTNTANAASETTRYSRLLMTKLN